MVCGVLSKEACHIGRAQGVVAITMPVMSGDCRPCPRGASWRGYR